MFRRAVPIALAVPFLSTLAVFAVGDAATDKDKKILQGKWEVVSLMFRGMDQPVPPGGIVLVFTGDKVESIKGGKTIKTGTFKVDASKTPKTLDLVEASETQFGIFEFKGDDEIKLCMGKTRPTAFSSTPDNDQGLVILKRVKK